MVMMVMMITMILIRIKNDDDRVDTDGCKDDNDIGDDIGDNGGNCDSDGNCNND